MIERQREPFAYGYNPITELEGKNSIAMLDFGIIKLAKGDTYSNEEAKERAFLLIKGEVKLQWEDKEQTIKRESCFDESPWCLHLPKNAKVVIVGQAESEFAYQAVYNDKVFDAKLYTQEECRSEQFGAGTLNEAATRTVRTIFDDSNAPYSNMVIGEVVNHPGKWSSYPPHHHPQPEVYHYRLNPEHGFGYSEQGEDVYKVRNNDTAIIEGGLTHPQTAAAGYAMYYVWGIPHLKEARFDERIFVDEHKWLLDPNAKVWPENK